MTTACEDLVKRPRKSLCIFSKEDSVLEERNIVLSSSFFSVCIGHFYISVERYPIPQQALFQSDLVVYT